MGRPRKRVGAYPVKHHLTCAEITRKNTSYDLSLQAPVPDGLAFRMNRGNEFEDTTNASMLKSFKRNGYNVVRYNVGENPDSPSKLNGHNPDELVVYFWCDGERSEESRERNFQATLHAMKKGARFIVNARLVTDYYAGEPDALSRCEGPGQSDRFSAWTYYGVDVKDHKSFDSGTKERTWQTSTMASPWYTKTTTKAYKGNPQLNDSLQLAMYWLMLDAHGRAGDKVGGIIGREGVVVWRRLDDALYRKGTQSALDIWKDTHASYRETIKAERARVRANDGRPPVSRAEHKPACGECVWRDVCREELEESRDITLLPEMTVARAKVHRDQGIERIDDLARLHWRTAALVDSGVNVRVLMETVKPLDSNTPVASLVSPKHGSALATQGVIVAEDVEALCVKTARYSDVKITTLAKSIDQARVFKAQRVHRARGIEHVELPRAAIELDVDIEDDSGGICYLIGVKETVRARGEVRSRYVPFVTWDNTTDGEAQVFAGFWTYLMDMKQKAKESKIGGFRVFYYTDHESRYFRHLARAHAGKPGIPTETEVDEFLTSDAWVDMHPVLGKQLVWPTQDRTLKSLAKYVRFFWRDEAPGGANSVAWYNEAISSDNPEKVEELRERLLAYNEDDVEATYVLRDWISRFGESRRPGTKLPGVEVLDARYGKRT